MLKGAAWWTACTYPTTVLNLAAPRRLRRARPVERKEVKEGRDGAGAIGDFPHSPPSLPTPPYSLEHSPVSALPFARV